MAPSQQIHHDKERRIKSIILFASELETQLPTAISSRSMATTILVQEIGKHVLSFPSKPIVGTASRWEELDRKGLTLWNICTKLKRGLEGVENGVPPILLGARLFAYLLLHCAWENGNCEPGSLPRIFKVSVRAAKSCYEAKNLDYTQRVLEKVGCYEDRLEKDHGKLLPEDVEICKPLVAEYYVLRTALAWQQGNFKIAEHMFNKSIDPTRLIDPRTAESLSDVLYEMGKDLLEQGKQYKMAITWLDRAYDVLNDQEPDRLSTDASELRVSILQSRIKTQLLLKTSEGLGQAQDLLRTLEDEMGGKLVVLLLRLEIITASENEPFDAAGYRDVLCKMIASLDMTDSNFKLIMFHIRKLNEKNCELACKSLDNLLTLRVLPDKNHERTEKVLITRLYLTMGESHDAVKGLKGFFDLIANNIDQPISAAASIGAHTLLWKRIESSYTQCQYEVAENWCRLALRDMFAQSGNVNMARISRKLLLCALGQGEFAKARHVFASMPESAKNENLTRFLMYKVALGSGEFELAAQCLQIIAASPSEDPGLLYACCLEALSTGSKAQQLEALLCVLEKYGYTDTHSINLPSLVRSAIRLMVLMIDGPKSAEGAPGHTVSLNKLCRMYEGAAESMNKALAQPRPNKTQWTVQELDWFSKNAYNLALEHVGDWDPSFSLRMILCCIKFIDHYPVDIGQQIADDLKLRKLFCEFSSGAALLALARGEDKIEVQLQNYLELRKHVESFDKLLEDRLGSLEEVSAQDLIQKLAILLTFDFEAACHLKAWGSLGEVILRAKICKSMKVYQLMADCLLCSEAPTTTIIPTMKKIINAAWFLEELDFVRLAKYMRCLIQISLSDNAEVAEELLDQVRDHAEQASETGQSYPTEELEWVVTTAFNHGIDLYCSEDDQGARNWTEKAVNLAGFSNDEGELQRLLQERLLSLRFK